MDSHRLVGMTTLSYARVRFEGENHPIFAATVGDSTLARPVLSSRNVLQGDRHMELKAMKNSTEHKKLRERADYAAAVAFALLSLLALLPALLA